MSQGTTDHALPVHLHDFRAVSPPDLKVHDDAVHALVDAEELEAKISRKGGQRLREVLAQVRLAVYRARRIAEQLRGERNSTSSE